jgi:hypothetical protein
VSATVLELGGRELPDALDDVRRYCGLPWSGGQGEVSAFSYYDALPERREDDVVRPVDVLSTAALHPGLRWRDLQYFSYEAPRLEDWLRTIPPGVDLADADEDLVEEVARLPERFDGHPGLSILSKVLHAKRPRLIPILDRTLTDWYRPISSRRGESAWQDCVRLLHGDLAAPSNRTILRAIRSELAIELGATAPSELRIADIAIWMQVRGFRAEPAEPWRQQAAVQQERRE